MQESQASRKDQIEQILSGRSSEPVTLPLPDEAHPVMTAPVYAAPAAAPTAPAAVHSRRPLLRILIPIVAVLLILGSVGGAFLFFGGWGRHSSPKRLGQALETAFVSGDVELLIDLFESVDSSKKVILSSTYLYPVLAELQQEDSNLSKRFREGTDAVHLTECYTGDLRAYAQVIVSVDSTPYTLTAYRRNGRWYLSENSTWTSMMIDALSLYSTNAK